MHIDDTSIMGFVVLSVVLTGILSTVMSANVNDCFTHYTDGKYLGCYEDSSDRILDKVYETFDHNSASYCMLYCGDLGYRFAGTQVGYECLCGHTLKSQIKKSDSECNRKCAGSDEMCGGSWRISVYRTGSSYQGCFEDAKDRILTNVFEKSDQNSVSYCIRLCANRGYLYAGLQVSIECFCGHTMKRQIQKADSECNRTCAGNDGMCGGSWRISVYKTENVASSLQEGGKFTLLDECGQCTCTWSDYTYHLSCESVACPELHCAEALHQMSEGACCPTCKPGCYVDNVGYLEKGQTYTTDDICETCSCEKDTQSGFHTVCNTMSCQECQYGYIEDNTCCGQCQQCPNECPDLPCKAKYQFQDDDMCCPDCMCRNKDELVKPGPVGDVCDGCECANGSISCNSVQCLNTTKLECVDPVKGDDCCYKCQNGETCRHPNKKQMIMLKNQPPKSVGKQMCMCSPNFWYPYAFCTKKSVKPSAFTLVENYKDVVAEWFQSEK